MKKVLALLLFSILVFNSSVFAQKGRTSGTKPLVQSSFVVYGGIEAFTDGAGVYLRWQTESETKNLGFLVHRAVGKSTELAGTRMIQGGYVLAREEQTFGGKYNYFDADGNAGTVYYIESISLDGQRQFSTPIYPQYVKNLAEITGTTSAEMRAARDASSSEIVTSELNMPKELASAIEANTAARDLNMQRFVAAQPGVKIGVRKEGLFRVTRAELQAAGFNVNTSPALWQLYKEGVEQSIIVEPNGDYIEFYGKDIDTIESATQIYYLIVGAQNGKRMGTRILRPFAGNVIGRSYAQTSINKLRTFYLSTVLNGDANNFFGPVVGNAGVTINFNLQAIDFGVSKTPIYVSVQGYSYFPHTIRVVLNGNELGQFSGENTDLMLKEFGVPTAMLNEGANTLQLTAMNGSQDTNFFDYIGVGHARLYKASNNQLSFYTNLYKASNLDGFTSPNIRVFDLTYPDDPTLITNLSITQPTAGNYSVRLPANRSYKMYAVENSAVSSPATIVQNIPSTLANAAHNARLLIVTHKNFMTEANAWANFRRSPGGGNFIVEVVDIEDVYDEFSYGILNTDGIRDFLQYAKNNWQTPPQYVLLLGDASYDYRNYEGNGYHNYIPTKLVDTVYMETGSDEALADFNDDGLAEIAVGRVPARLGSEVTQNMNKSMAFEGFIVPTWLSRGALFVSDEPIGYDFDGLSHRLRDQLPSNMNITFILRNQPSQAESRNTMLGVMNQGKYLVNYSGHGSTGFWAVPSPAFFNSTDALGLSNGNNVSIFMMLTCLNGYFINQNDSLAEALLKAPNGGAVVAWTSTGKTTPDVQEQMATRFLNQVTAGNMTRMGDLVKDAKTVVIGGRDVRLSWVLLGDPTLNVR
jgi:Peptidase family C25